MLFGAMLLAASLSVTSISPTCKTTLGAEWPGIRQAMGADDTARAIKGLIEVEAACKDDPVTHSLLTTMHAEADLRAGRAQAAIDRLNATPVDSADRLWPTNRWVALSALEVVGDAEGFRAVRDAFLVEHDRALTTGPGAMRKVERFQTPLAVVDAYEGRILNGAFVRLIVFVASPNDGGMPVTLAVGMDPATDLLAGGAGGKDHYFVDLYPCDQHATMDIIERKKKQGPPPYAEMRARADKLFSSVEAFAPFAKRDAYRFCAFETFMLPGFSYGDEEE